MVFRVVVIHNYKVENTEIKRTKTQPKKEESSGSFEKRKKEGRVRRQQPCSEKSLRPAVQ